MQENSKAEGCSDKGWETLADPRARATRLMAGLLQCYGDWGQQELLPSGGMRLIVLQSNGDWGQLSAQEIINKTFREFDT